MKVKRWHVPAFLALLLYASAFGYIPALVYYQMPDKSVFSVPFLIISNIVAWGLVTTWAVVGIVRGINAKE